MNYNLLMILSFGIIIYSLQVIVMLNRKVTWGALSSKLAGITLIVIASISLVISDIQIEKITAVIGLLGTVAGYLIGKSEKDKEHE